MQDGFVKVAARSPQVRVADVDANVEACIAEVPASSRTPGAVGGEAVVRRRQCIAPGALSGSRPRRARGTAPTPSAPTLRSL